VDGQSCYVIAGALDFAGMQTGADIEAEAVGVGDDLFRAAHALTRPGEEGEHAVAGRLDRLPAESRDGGPRVLEMAIEHI
jgi:hypothetical protein